MNHSAICDIGMHAEVREALEIFQTKFDFSDGEGGTGEDHREEEM